MILTYSDPGGHLYSLGISLTSDAMRVFTSLFRPLHRSYVLSNLPLVKVGNSETSPFLVWIDQLTGLTSFRLAICV